MTSAPQCVDRPYAGKRLADLALLAVLGPPAVLLGAGCAIAVRRSSPGPILFRQDRIGRDGEPFELLKFRTMLHSGLNPLFPDHTRITGAGRWLRRLSLDELPQLVNVLRGEMSLVGPRPTLAYQVQRYTDEQRRRLSVRPGLTGLAQVSGRNALPWSDRITLDLRYVQRQSFRLDLEILARTVWSVVQGGGVDGHPLDDLLAVLPDPVSLSVNRLTEKPCLLSPRRSAWPGPWLARRSSTPSAMSSPPEC